MRETIPLSGARCFLFPHPTTPGPGPRRSPARCSTTSPIHLSPPPSGPQAGVLRTATGMDSRQGVLTGLYVLVVDDDLDAREILSSVLGYFGAFVTVSKGVADARRLLHEVAPDVVLAD